jgi:hypothetical protein
MMIWKQILTKLGTGEIHSYYVRSGRLSRVIISRVYGILGHGAVCGRDVPMSVIVKTTAQCVRCHLPEYRDLHLSLSGSSGDVLWTRKGTPCIPKCCNIYDQQSNRQFPIKNQPNAEYQISLLNYQLRTTFVFCSNCTNSRLSVHMHYIYLITCIVCVLLSFSKW